MSSEHKPTPGLYGSISHTEFASNNPDATKRWCETVLGWSFMQEFPSPSGDYHLFTYSDTCGGGIRRPQANESTGSTPFVHVQNTDDAFDRALQEGAEAILLPDTVMEGVRIAIVKVPGDVLIGFSGPG